jgi:signal transduction histidine kinase
MQPLALTSVNRALREPVSLSWAHDVRNALATIGLHLETLARVSGPHGMRPAQAAQAALDRVSAVCRDAIAEAAKTGRSSRRRGFDLVMTVREVIAILEPAAPEGFEFRFSPGGSYVALAEPGDVFRILFNLVQNAVALARKGKAIRHVTIALSRSGTAIAVRVSDDGPGLPKTLRAGLFRRQGAAGAPHGYGLAIARELAERNGGALSLAPSARGATFVLELAAVASVERNGGGAEPPPRDRQLLG